MLHEMAQPDGNSIEPSKGMKVTVFGIKKKFPSVRNINTATLSGWMRGAQGGELHRQTTDTEQQTQPHQLLLLDARPVEEYEISHIPGAIRVDYTKQADEILSHLPTIKDSSVPSKVVCYCSVGYRSSMVAETLSNHYQKQEDSKTMDIYNLEGSIFQWANEGRAMVNKMNQPTKYAHPYNTMFGMLLNSDLRKKEV